MRTLVCFIKRSIEFRSKKPLGYCFLTEFTMNCYLDWMKLDISDSDANLASCNIHDGDTVAFEEVAGIELESG